MICIGSGPDLATAQRATDLASREPDVFAAIGIHPTTRPRSRMTGGRCWTRWPAAPAWLGGRNRLDYFYHHSPRDKTGRGLSALPRAQSGRAPALHLPRTRRPRGCPRPPALGVAQRSRRVVHCFSGNLDDARGYLDLGLDLSFSGILTFRTRKRSAAWRVCSPALDLGGNRRSLPGADALRGKRNEPSFVVKTLEALALVRGSRFHRRPRPPHKTRADGLRCRMSWAVAAGAVVAPVIRR